MKYGDYYRRDSFGLRKRKERFSRFFMPIYLAALKQAQAEGRRVKILDIGGTPTYWETVGNKVQARDAHITLVNIDYWPTDQGQESELFTKTRGDGCHLPEYENNSFDIVHSNSVIEHVGSWSNMRKMANEVMRLAPYYYVQVPYFWFPIEPHYRAPFFHWIPEQWRARLLMRFRLGFKRQPAQSLDAAMNSIESCRLLDRKQLRDLFPNAEHYNERMFLLTKSLIAASRIES